jgi:hypothetical protein
MDGCRGRAHQRHTRCLSQRGRTRPRWRSRQARPVQRQCWRVRGHVGGAQSRQYTTPRSVSQPQDMGRLLPHCWHTGKGTGGAATSEGILGPFLVVLRRPWRWWRVGGVSVLRLPHLGGWVTQARRARRHPSPVRFRQSTAMLPPQNLLARFSSPVVGSRRVASKHRLAARTEEHGLTRTRRDGQRHCDCQAPRAGRLRPRGSQQHRASPGCIHQPSNASSRPRLPRARTARGRARPRRPARRSCSLLRLLSARTTWSRQSAAARSSASRACIVGKVARGDGVGHAVVWTEQRRQCPVDPPRASSTPGHPARAGGAHRAVGVDRVQHGPKLNDLGRGHWLPGRLTEQLGQRTAQEP